MATAEEKAAAKAAKEKAAEEAKAAKEAEKAAKEAEKAAAKAAKTSVTVEWNGGARVYSKEVHGENFADLADEFVAKHTDKKAKIVSVE